MVNKEGVSHIEAVISFVIFIGFLIFAYFFFSPFESDRTLDSTLDYTYREVSDHSQIEAERYSLKVIDSDVASQVSISLNSLISPNVSVEDSSGTAVPYYVYPGPPTHKINFDIPTSDRFVRVTYAPYLTNAQNGPSGNIDPLSSFQYSISSYEKKEFYSVNRLVNLSEDYRKDYVGLKKRFNLPNRVDFEFSVVLNNGSIIKGEQNKPDNVEVKAKIDRIEIMSSNGASNFGDLIVRVW